MSGFNTILFPTDGSDGAEAALEAVRDLAETYGGTVHVLYVVDASHPAVGIGEDPKPESSPGMVGDPEGADTPMGGERELGDEIRREAREYGKNVVEEVSNRLEGLETVTGIESGNPAEVILEYANEHEADVVVLGTHGRTGIKRYLIGSVTEKVIRTTDVPILAVPLESED